MLVGLCELQAPSPNIGSCCTAFGVIRRPGISVEPRIGRRCARIPLAVSGSSRRQPWRQTADHHDADDSCSGHIKSSCSCNDVGSTARLEETERCSTKSLRIAAPSCGRSPVIPSWLTAAEEPCISQQQPCQVVVAVNVRHPVPRSGRSAGVRRPELFRMPGTSACPRSASCVLRRWATIDLKTARSLRWRMDVTSVGAVVPRRTSHHDGPNGAPERIRRSGRQ